METFYLPDFFNMVANGGALL